MGRNKTKVKKQVVTFALPEDVLQDFDKTIEEFNKRNAVNFTRSGVLQILVLKYIINTMQDFIKEDTDKQKEIKEEK